MLRGWENPESPFDNAPESPNGDLLSPNEADDQSQEEPGQEVEILRDWGEANEEEEEDEFDEIGLDPLTPFGDNSSVGGWSVAPGALDRNSFNIPYDYDNEDGSSFAERTSTSPRAGRSTKTCLNMSKDDIDQTSSDGATMFDDIDLEALADTLPSPSSNQDGVNRRYKGAWTKRLLHEIRTNPTFKFKLVVSGSVALVATCLIAIAVTLSSGKKSNPMQSGAVSSVHVFTDTKESTDFPTLLPTSNPSVSPSNKPPTGSPSYVPTFEPTLLPSTLIPTENPTSALTTASPSSHPTTSTPTYDPSMSPVTFSPTMDCADADGNWMTYNDKLRDCAWLDNDHNGAESARKDMNCLDSVLGEKCRYTCRLYNGCMDYLLSAISDYTETNDISIGDSCANKDGMFLSHGGTPRNCTWITEDPSTAPMKKNLNCGTPDIDRSELGVMCPATCVGYNDCQITESGDIVKVVTAPIGEAPVREEEDGVDTNEGDFVTEQQNLTVRMDDIGCVDEDGLWLNHMGKYRQCRWFFTNDFEVEEKKMFNCGITEIGRRCKEACGCGELHEGLVDVSSPGPEAEGSDGDDLKKEARDEQVRCENEEGKWVNHEENSKHCRWLDFDGEINAEAKKMLNCGKEGKFNLLTTDTTHAAANSLTLIADTEIGLKCRETCGCGDATSLETTTCEDKSGEWKTNDGDKRTCEWMDRNYPRERRDRNCGKTEIGVMCQCKCQELIQDAHDITGVGYFIQVFEPPTPAPVDTRLRKHQGRLDETGNIMTIVAMDDATVSQRNEKENFGDSIRLIVDSSGSLSKMRMT